MKRISGVIGCLVAFVSSACLGGDETAATVTATPAADSGTGGSAGSAGSGGCGVTGSTVKCACPGGVEGAQACKADGTLDSCVCPTGDGGSGGSAGTGGTCGACGGSTGIGGTSGTGGAGGTSGTGGTGGNTGGTGGDSGTGGVGGAGGNSGTGGASGTGGDSGTGGIGGSAGCSPAGKTVECACVGGMKGAQVCGTDGVFGLCDCPTTKSVTFEIVLPGNIPGFTGTTLFGITKVGSQYQGKMASWCDSNTPTPSQKLVQSGNSFSCTVQLPVLATSAEFNFVVEATGGTAFPSNMSSVWACYGVGINCGDASCFAPYGTPKVNGVARAVPGDAVTNLQGGCNFSVNL